MSDKPTIPEVLPMLKAYITKEGNSVGGSLHIVLDDGNIEDSNVEFCIKSASERGDAEGAELGFLLLTMSKTQRKKLSELVWKE